jgi:broad specificity phosphatase PhoE
MPPRTDVADEAWGPPARTVYLVRHATPDLTRTDLVYYLPPGPPLTTIGEHEATELGRFLCRGGVRRIWTSPLERARRTAKLAAKACAAEVVTDVRLTEMQPGETHDDVDARARPVWDVAVQTAAAQGPQALVAHGGVITALLLALGVAPTTLEQLGRRFDSGNPLPPGGAWEVTGPDATGAVTARLAFVPSVEQAASVRPSNPPAPVNAPGARAAD